jgi:GntR family transcriptional regulator / MocR family aminotransferase
MTATELALSGSGPKAQQIYLALRERILSGALPAGARLPGSRALARDLRVARGTVTAAYERLQAEGYCASEARSALWVSDVMPREQWFDAGDQHATMSQPHPIVWRGDAEPVGFDLRFGLPNVADFPHKIWSRVARRELAAHAGDDFEYPHPEGLPRLRAAIAAHLRRRRGLDCSATDVLITHGAQQAFSLIARALLPAGVPVAMEDPGYRGFSQAVRAAGLTVDPISVDDQGLRVDRLSGRTVSAVFVTPAHQFPSGVLLSAARRRELLDWAEHAGTWIIEDDYDSEYRFGAPPIEPLKHLDGGGRVLLVGSFSKTVFPGLRLGFVVAPPPQLQQLALLKNLDDAGSANGLQATLAGFMESGQYGRHLRRSLRRNAERRAALIEAIDHQFGCRARIHGDAAGLHIVVDLGLSQVQERALVESARRRGVGLYGLGAFYQGEVERTGLVLGYARLEVRAQDEAVALLRRVVEDVERRRGDDR